MPYFWKLPPPLCGRFVSCCSRSWVEIELKWWKEFGDYVRLRGCVASGPGRRGEADTVGIRLCNRFQKVFRKDPKRSDTYRDGILIDQMSRSKPGSWHWSVRWRPGRTPVISLCHFAVGLKWSSKKQSSPAKFFKSFLATTIRSHHNHHKSIQIIAIFSHITSAARRATCWRWWPVWRRSLADWSASQLAQRP